MKRILFALIVLLVAFAGVAMAQGITLSQGQSVVYKFVPKSWEFARSDGQTISVIVDPAGTITVLVDGVFIGQRYDSCQVAN